MQLIHRNMIHVKEIQSLTRYRLTFGIETLACSPLIFTLSGLTDRSVWPWEMEPGVVPSVLDSLCSCLAVWLCEGWEKVFIDLPYTIYYLEHYHLGQSNEELESGD